MSGPDYRDLLEPAAAAEAPEPTNWTGGPNEALLTGATLSMAVSLKRIADLLEGGFFVEEFGNGAHRVAPPIKTKGEAR